MRMCAIAVCLSSLAFVCVSERLPGSSNTIHLAQNCSPTDTLKIPDEHPVLLSPPAADPRWVMLSMHLRRKDIVVDDKTAAESRTSTGRGFRVSTNLAPPSATSYLCYHWDGNHSSDGKDPDKEYPLKRIVAAHGDSVIFRITHNLNNWSRTHDYFVYRAGAATGKPSLTLLPTNHLSDKMLSELTTGLLRCSDDELLVVELDGWNQCGPVGGKAADLNVLRLGSSEWEKRSAVPIVPNEGSRCEMLPKHWIPERVVPVGDRFLCWVNYSISILMCDMADTSLMIRQFPLPVMPRERRHGGHGFCTDDEDAYFEMQYCRNMCGAGAEALRFVSIDPRCCCGGPGRGTCPHSRFAFTVTTWTMSLRTVEQMVWVKDGVLDCEELWALPGYEGLPRVPLDCPVISLDNPDIVFFNISDCHVINDDKYKVWMLEVDMRRKALLSVVQCPDRSYGDLPAKLHYC